MKYDTFASAYRFKTWTSVGGCVARGLGITGANGPERLLSI